MEPAQDQRRRAAGLGRTAGFQYSSASSLITEDRLALARARSTKDYTSSLDPSELATLRGVQDRLEFQDRPGIDMTQDASLKEEDEEENRSVVLRNLTAAMYTANLRARSDGGVALGVQSTGDRKQLEDSTSSIDHTDISHVRKPNLFDIISKRDRLDPSKRPKYTLKQVLFSTQFRLYKHRFGNAQWNNALVFPTLPQPKKDAFGGLLCGECAPASERDRTRRHGHRFIVAADTQFGILMDGFAMEHPNWSREIEISRRCVARINAMEGDDRPLFVCVCGDLVDTEASFHNALGSWKKVMRGWERHLVFEQQVRDFKRVWANLHPDIALVCLCGNHDIGNRPTRASIGRWTAEFGDDFFAFWVNGTYNIALNNCLFSNPTGAPDLYQEQLSWLEEKLAHGRAHNATHMFVYGHFPWFLRHEEEGSSNDPHPFRAALDSKSAPPSGWGPEGSKFADSYFTVPYERRKVAMALFRKYGVTACFSGHFHQNVVAKTSWGMPMIVTGPLSMNLESDILNELSGGEALGLGMRIIDVGEKGEFTHKWTLLDE